MRTPHESTPQAISETILNRDGAINQFLSKSAQLTALVLAACSPTPELPPKPSVEQVAADLCAHGIEGTIKPIKGAPKNTGFAAVLDEREGLIHGHLLEDQECKPGTGIVPHAMAGHLLDSEAYLATDGAKWSKTYTFTPKGEKEFAETRENAKWLDIPDNIGVEETLHSVFLVVGKEPNKPVFTDGVKYGYLAYEEVLSESFPRAREPGQGCVSVGFIKTLEGLQGKPYGSYLYILSQNDWAYGGTPITVEAFLKGMEGAKGCNLSSPVEPSRAKPKKTESTRGTEGYPKITPRVSRAKQDN